MTSELHPKRMCAVGIPCSHCDALRSAKARLADPTSERNIQNAIRLAVGSLPDVRIWRNNVGMIRDSRGVPVRYGLAVGSADLIGIVAPYGTLLSIEVKAPGRANRTTKEQDNWARLITEFGGVAGIVTSVEEALALVERARKPLWQ